MALLQSDPPLADAPTREFIVRVERAGRLPRPWIWAIYEGNRPDALHRSGHSYRSAEDAWVVGNMMWAQLGPRGWRKSEAPVSRETNIFAEVRDEVMV
jgi:hypothetical protein